MTSRSASIKELQEKLDTDGKTERRNAAKHIRELLDQLDEDELRTSHHSSQQTTFSWSKLFSASKAFFDRESTSLRKEEGKSKSSSTVTREKKLISDATGLLRAVVKECCKRKAKFDVGSLVDLILDVLGNIFLRKLFGKEFTNILSKDLLPKENYCWQVPRQKWNDLFDVYCELLLDNSGHVDPFSAAKLLNVLCQKLSLQCDVDIETVGPTLERLSRAINKFSQEKSLALELVLAIVNAYCLAVSSFAPVCVSHFGGTHWDLLLQLYALPQSAKLKDVLVEFFCIHCALHKDRVAQKEWQDFLTLLYEVLIKELGTKEGEKERAKQGYMYLSVEVMHQMIGVQKEKAESEMSNDDPRVWARLCKCFNKAVGRLTSLISLLQVVTTLIECHPSCISLEEGQLVFTEVHELQRQSKNKDVLSLSMKCLNMLALSCNGILDVPFQEQWHSVFKTTARVLFSKQMVQSEGFQLLATLVKHSKEFAGDFDDVWKLWSSGSIQLTPGCCEFIEECVLSHGLPHLPPKQHTDLTLTNETIQQDQVDDNDLISWILNRMAKSSQSSPSENPGNVARLLFLLTQLKCKGIAPRVTCPSKPSFEFFQKLDHIADCKLETALVKTVKASKFIAKETTRLVIVNTEKRTHLITSFLAYTRSLHSTSAVDSRKSAVYTLHVLLYWLLEFGESSGNDLCKENFLLKAFLRLSDSVFGALIGQKYISVSDVLESVKSMLELVLWNQSDRPEKIQRKRSVICAWSVCLSKLVGVLNDFIGRKNSIGDEEDEFMETSFSPASFLSQQPGFPGAYSGATEAASLALPARMLGICYAIISDMESYLLDDPTVQETTRHLVLQLLQANEDGLARNLDTDQMLSLCSVLVDRSHQLSEEMIGAVLLSVRFVLYQHVRNLTIVSKACQVFSALPRHLQHSALLNPDCVDNCTKIINGIKGLCNRNMLSPSVRRQFVFILKNFMKIPVPVASYFDASRFRDDLVEFLKDSSHLVRYSAASSLDALFAGPNIPPDGQTQQQMFSRVCEILKSYQNCLAKRLASDESINSCACILHALGQVMVTSAVCRKIALFDVILLVNKHTFEMATTLLRQASIHLGYPSQSEMLNTHLHYIICRWLEERGDLASYPFQMHSTSSLEEFLNVHIDSVLPYLTLYVDDKTLRLLAASLHRDLGELLRRCAPRCLAYVLPEIVKESVNGIAPERLKRAFGILTAFMDTQAVLYQSFSEILLNLLFCLYEFPQVAFTGTGIKEYEKGFPSYSTDQIKSLIGSLLRNHSTAFTVIDLLCVTVDGIHTVLLGLRSRLLTAVETCEQKRLAMALHFFTELIMPYVKTGMQGSREFVVRDVIYTVSHLSAKCNADEGTKSVCLAILSSLCEHCKQSVPQLLNTYLRVVCNVFVNIASEVGTILQGKVVRVLMDLLGDRTYQRTICYLDSFPDSEAFSELSAMQADAKIQLGSTIEKNTNCGLSLNHLLDQASQLSDSSCPDQAQVRRLLSAFTEAVRHWKSADDMLLVQIAKKLGKIGPVDLQSLLNANGSQDDGQPMQRLGKMLSLLDNLLLEENVEVVKAASACLKSIFGDKKGSALAWEYEKTKFADSSILARLEPFRIKPENKNSVLPVNVVTADETIGKSSLWRLPGQEDGSHGDWIIALTSALLSSTAVTDVVLTKLLPMCQIKASFAEKVFPYLVFDILRGDASALRRTLSDLVQEFFDRVEEASMCFACRRADMSVLVDCIECKKKVSQMDVDKRSIFVMLDMVSFLQRQEKPGFAKNSWESNFWLDLNYLKLARAAQVCSAYFLSLLYIEIWCGTRKAGRSVRISQPSPMSSNKSIDISGGSGGVLLRQDSMMRGNHYSALIEAYCHLGEPDGLLGAAALCSPSESVLLKVYQQTGQWTRVLQECDLHMKSSSDRDVVCLLKAMDRLGLNHTMDAYFHQLGTSHQLQAEEIDCRYELAWRNCQWDLEGIAGPLNESFNGRIYETLDCLRKGEFDVIPSILDEARHDMCKQWSQTGMDSSLEVYPLLAKLQCLVEIEETCSASKKDNFDDLVDGLWRARLSNNIDDTECMDLVCCVRTSALKAATNRAVPSFGLSESLVAQLKSQAEFYQRKSFHQKMGCVLKELDAFGNDLPEPRRSLVHWEWRKMKAELFWDRKEVDNALRFIKLLCKELNEADLPQESLLYGKALLLCGNWLAESKSESPSVIITEYLEEAVSKAKNVHSKGEHFLAKAYFSLARFADQQYQSITHRMESNTFASRRNVTTGQKEELRAIRQDPSAQYDPSIVVFANRLVKQVQLDESELKVMLKERRVFLLTALHSYCSCLQAGDDFDIRVYRLCSLWFESRHEEGYNKLVDEEFSKIQSRKFLPVMYQLAARLGSVMDDPAQRLFQSILRKTIERACVDHPFHAVYIVMALGSGHAANGNSFDVQPPSKKPRLKVKKQTSLNDKAEAVAAILAKVRTSRPVIMCDTEKLVNAYIQLANVTDPLWKKGSYGLPRGGIKSVTDLRTAVLTDHIPVDMSCRYDDVVTVREFKHQFKIPGGKSMPKMIVCIGSDGVERRQLVKGGDDLRQDAVMQQVFGVVNHLLARDADTRKRELRMRTYKVIPLTKLTGVVEWCDGTVPFGTYLIGDGCGYYDSAHYRYEAKDWKAKECREKLAQAQSAKKLRIFTMVTDHFRPVFRHFFTERFPQACQWYERKMAYSRSVAVSSMVGYIVGLGDRHVQNILIDQKTAEIIHIDLGVAFEQGRLLPSPETIPFRLTRDIVDGMGVTGVEGVFRCACEKTLALLRTSEEALTAIIEVLLHDPLSDWSAGRLKATKSQRSPVNNHESAASTAVECSDDGKQEEVDGFATRVLLRVREKLEGIEDRVVLSVDGQVKHLIQVAMNPDNLCRLYHGWQAFV